MNLNLLDIVYIILPGLLCYGIQAICSVGKDAGGKVKFRPPAWFFSVIWPILFLLLGISLMLSMRRNTNKYLTFFIYTLLILSLVLWLFFYGCRKNKIVSLWILIISFSLSLSCFALGDVTIKLLLCPFIAWILFAILMNKTEVQTIE